MADPLDGVWVKLDRADHHLDTLDEAIERFLDDRPYEAISEFDAKTGECVVRFEVHRQAPVLDWAPVIGDCLFNLRSALDNLVWVLAEKTVKARGAGEPQRRVEFPIYIDPRKFNEDRKTKIGDLDGAAQAVVERLQPYCRSKRRPHADLLWIVHELNRVDKHRYIHVTAAIWNSVTYWVSRIEEMFGFDALQSISIGPVEDGAELMRLPVPRVGACSDVAMQLNLAYGIAFDPEGPGRGRSVLGTLGEGRDLIRDQIIPAFIPLL